MAKSLPIAIFFGLAVAAMASGHRTRQAGDDPLAVQRSADAAGHAIPIETRVRRSPNGHFFVTALVNGRPVRFVVDTGATMVALTVEDARRAGLAFDQSSFAVIGEGASGPVRGQALRLASVELDGKERLHVSAAVIEGGGISMLGQTYLSRLNSVQMTGDQMILR